MAYKLVQGGEFDPTAWSLMLEQQIIPNIAKARPWPAWHAMRDVPEAEDTHSEALVNATMRFAPPEGLPGSAELYAAMMAMVALRASTGSFVSSFSDVAERYAKAGDWLCENLGELIFWDCD